MSDKLTKKQVEIEAKELLSEIEGKNTGKVKVSEMLKRMEIRR